MRSRIEVIGAAKKYMISPLTSERKENWKAKVRWAGILLRSFYGLSFCAPPPLPYLCWNVDTQCNSLEVGPLGGVWAMRRALIIGINALRDLIELPSPFHVRHCLGTRMWALTSHCRESTGTMILDFVTSRTFGKKCFLLISHQVCGIFVTAVSLNGLKQNYRIMKAFCSFSLSYSAISNSMCRIVWAWGWLCPFLF